MSSLRKIHCWKCMPLFASNNQCERRPHRLTSLSSFFIFFFCLPRCQILSGLMRRADSCGFARCSARITSKSRLWNLQCSFASTEPQQQRKRKRLHSSKCGEHLRFKNVYFLAFSCIWPKFKEEVTEHMKMKVGKKILPTSWRLNWETQLWREH